jgi:hypothetical protein
MPTARALLRAHQRRGGVSDAALARHSRDVLRLPGTDRCSQIIIDSTGVLEIIGFVETTFGITVEDEERVPQNLDSIDGIARFVLRKQALVSA